MSQSRREPAAGADLVLSAARLGRRAVGQARDDALHDVVHVREVAAELRLLRPLQGFVQGLGQGFVKQPSTCKAAAWGMAALVGERKRRSNDGTMGVTGQR